MWSFPRGILSILKFHFICHSLTKTLPISYLGVNTPCITTSTVMVWGNAEVIRNNTYGLVALGLKYPITTGYVLEFREGWFPPETSEEQIVELLFGYRSTRPPGFWQRKSRLSICRQHDSFI